jgi:hypothetical protein
MRGKLLVLVLAVTVVAGLFAGSATASGPAAPGKELITLNCEGLGDLEITVQRGENSNGAGQIVDTKGHGIPVAIAFTFTDVTTQTVLDSESFAVGDGHAHSNQATIHCSGVTFEGTASDVFGQDLPPGVSATDTIMGSIDVDVVIKGT